MSDPYSVAAGNINIPFNPYSQIEALDYSLSPSYQMLQNSLSPNSSVVSVLTPPTAITPKPITAAPLSLSNPLILMAGGAALILVMVMARN